MVKGIQTAEDAELCVKHGVDIIYVSNHGGRQLDHGRGAIELLPEVISVARGKAEFVIDGGFVRGTDVLKGVARGAAMVGIGKLQALALGAAGDRGVVRMLEILETELTVSMKLLGHEHDRRSRRHLSATGDPCHRARDLERVAAAMRRAARC